MQAKETVFADLMQGRTQQFQVPLYQRTYSWSEKQLAQLWNDVLEQAELRDSGASASTHFLGSVVLAPSPQNEATFPRWLVVDGQQRLTTLSLALMAIRDHIAEDKPDEAERIDEEYLINKRKRGDEYFRLLPTQADRPQFATHVRGPLTEQTAGDRVAAAYQFFRRKLDEADAAAGSQDILHIEQAITSRLTLVVVSAERGDNVHRIFESLNNTGLKLSQADLLRNYLFMCLPTHGERIYETYWLPLQASLTNDELEQLMWLQLVLDGDDRVRRQDLYAAQQKRFEGGERGTGRTEADIEAYIRELHRRSALFRKVIHPEEESAPAVRGHLRRLHDWQAVVTYPALMLLLERRASGELDDEETVRALSYVESFLVRRTICRVNTNNLNRIFQAVPAQLPREVPVADGLHQLLSADNRQWPADEELRDKIRTAPFYQYGRPSQRKLVLQRLEESFEHPEPVAFDEARLTIEHVMPQSPGDEWLRILRAEVAEGESPEDLHSRLQHTLGNLTLTGVNAELSNHPFERKQGLLNGSHLEMNRRIAATGRWGSAEILARADDLADRAIGLWPARCAAWGAPSAAVTGALPIRCSPRSRTARGRRTEIWPRTSAPAPRLWATTWPRPTEWPTRTGCSTPTARWPMDSGGPGRTTATYVSGWALTASTSPPRGRPMRPSASPAVTLLSSSSAPRRKRTRKAVWGKRHGRAPTSRAWRRARRGSFASSRRTTPPRPWRLCPS